MSRYHRRHEGLSFVPVACLQHSTANPQCTATRVQQGVLVTSSRARVIKLASYMSVFSVPVQRPHAMPSHPSQRSIRFRTSVERKKTRGRGCPVMFHVFAQRRQSSSCNCKPVLHVYGMLAAHVCNISLLGWCVNFWNG